jgi:hypothetical protein
MRGAVENDRERAFPALFARAWDSVKPDVRLNRELWFCSGVFGHWLSLKFGMEGFIPRANPIHRLDLANHLVVFFRPFPVVCRLSFPRWSNIARNLQSRCSEFQF